MMLFAPLLLWAPTLFDQTVVRVLQTNYPAAQFVLVDVASKSVLGANWPHFNEPIPFGSLAKPFIALTASPQSFTCDPAKCWQPKGHGKLRLEQAIAESCNSYFLQLNATLAEPDVRRTIDRYNLPQPADTKPTTLTGLGDWRWTPTEAALAFAQLANDSKGVAVRRGMLASGQSGTAKALRGLALAKTGTAPCSHARKAPGDGYVAMLYPPSTPKYVLLIEVHGVSGAVAATTAAEMLNVVRYGK